MVKKKKRRHVVEEEEDYYDDDDLASYTEDIRYAESHELSAVYEEDGDEDDYDDFNDEDCNDTIRKIDFLEDKPGHQTLGRRIATLLSKYSWYNPKLRLKNEADNDGKKIPSIAEAWAFFEHVTLSRYEIPQDQTSTSMIDLQAKPRPQRCCQRFLKGERRLAMAEPGECEIPTKLYSPFHTPLSQMGDFGEGYGLYFSTLRGFTVLSLIAGLINIPNLIYFASDEYSPDKDYLGNFNMSIFLKTSAICTDKDWVPCPDCTFEQFDTQPYPSHKLIWGIKDINETTIINGTETNTTTEKTMLGAAEYFGVDTGDDSDWKLTYTEESLAKLKQDYNITYTRGTRKSVTGEGYGYPVGWCEKPSAGEPTTITFDGYGEYVCNCTDDCFSEVIFCDNEEDCSPYISLSFPYKDFDDDELQESILNPLPPYGDAAVFPFASKNNCDGATRQQGIINLTSIFVFFFGAFVVRMKQQELAIKFDEDEQTAQDYSINILNPPIDAHDCDEWKSFFEKNFADCHVTVVTVDTDNDHILKLFIERREILRQIENLLPDGTPLDIESLDAQVERKAAKKGRFFFRSPVPSLVSRLKEQNHKIKTELKKHADYPVTNVFVTFETETAQRNVLQTLTVGSVAATKNDTTKVPAPRFLFRGKYVLEIIEPEEPNAITWDELNATKSQIVIRLVITTIITAMLIVVSFFFIVILYQVGTLVATTVTTLLTSAFPMVAAALAKVEIHRSESSRQKWMFIKIASYYVVLTTVLISSVTPFLATLDETEGSSSPGLISSVHALFFSQIIISPFLQLLDPMGNINRHILAPRAKTQEAMNLRMQGSQMFLADRYANMIKFLFLMVWYCAVYPGAFFMGTAALLIVYFFDRFSLMRTWARAPMVGSQIAEFSQEVFQPVAVVLMILVSTYFWAGFKFDNLCEDDATELDPNYVGDWHIDIQGIDAEVLGATVSSTPGLDAYFTIEPDAQVYKYCLQNFREFEGVVFPPLPESQPEGSEWMTEDQEDVVRFFGRISVTILFIVGFMFIYQIVNKILDGYRSTYEPHGKDMKIKFSTVKSIDSYIPEKKSSYFTYPLLLCDLDDIDPNLFSWSDPNRPHSYYSVFEDIKEIMNPKDVKVPYVFSDVKHWDPNRDYEMEAKLAALAAAEKKKKKKRKKRRKRKKTRKKKRKKKNRRDDSDSEDEYTNYSSSRVSTLGASATDFNSSATDFDGDGFDSDDYESSSDESSAEEAKVAVWEFYDLSKGWTAYKANQQQGIETCFQGFKTGGASSGSTVVIEMDGLKHEVDVLFMKEKNLEHDTDERDVRRSLMNENLYKVLIA